MNDVAVPNRRPLTSRGTWWAKALSSFLAKRRVSPNGISVVGIFFAIGAGVAFWGTSRVDDPRVAAALFVCAAAGIQLRLICNLLDGMVAVEGGLKSKTGDVFNDLPDRIEDSAILVPAGFAAIAPFGMHLAWCAALLAVFCAYVRLLGGSLKLPQDFRGPMAKQHRMATMTSAALVEAALCFFGHRGWAMTFALLLIIAGAVITAIRRIARILRELEAR